MRTLYIAYRVAALDRPIIKHCDNARIKTHIKNYYCNKLIVQNTLYRCEAYLCISKCY